MIRCLSILAIALAAIPAAAQDLPVPPQPRAIAPPPPISIKRYPTMPGPIATLTLTASADVARAPDQLRLTAGVVSTAPTAAEAMAANAARMNAVLAALKAAGVAGKDVQTTGLSLNPQYRYQPEQPPILTGYQARNAVSIRTTRLADAGKLVDAAIKAGANEVQGPEFSLANPDAALDEARAAAVASGRARAELYAKAAGLKVRRITSISEAGAAPEPGPRPMMRAAMAAESGAPPVQPGEISLSVQVTMSFYLEGEM